MMVKENGKALKRNSKCVRVLQSFLQLTHLVSQRCDDAHHMLHRIWKRIRFCLCRTGMIMRKTATRRQRKNTMVCTIMPAGQTEISASGSQRFAACWASDKSTITSWKAQLVKLLFVTHMKAQQIVARVQQLERRIQTHLRRVNRQSSVKMHWNIARLVGRGCKTASRISRHFWSHEKKRKCKSSRII